MLEQYIISDIRQLKALSHSSRVRILSALSEQPMTAKQLADLFGEEPAKTSYHVKQLLKVGLVELVFTRETQNGIVEKYYRAIAKEFQTDPYLARQPEGRTQLETSFLRNLNKAQSDFLRAYRADAERGEAPQPEQVIGIEAGPKSAFGQRVIAADPARMQAFLNELKTLMDRYFDPAQQQPDADQFGFHFLLYPMLDSKESMPGGVQGGAPRS